MDNIIRLEKWFASQCDGDWEHDKIFDITNLDNPGWRFVVNIDGVLGNMDSFKELKVERSDQDWIHCKVEGKEFYGWGGEF